VTAARTAFADRFACVGRQLLPLVVIAWLLGGCGTATARDHDKDKLPDSWERQYHFSTTHRSGAADPDRDGLNNLQEYKRRLNPRRADTDGDGLKDGAEVKRYRTNPRNSDTDGDGVKDGDEIRNGTDPRSRDSVHGAPGAGPAPAVGVQGNGSAATPPPSCDADAAPSSLASVLAAAAANTRICMAGGDYGTFSGAQAPGRVTLAPKARAAVTMRLEFKDASNLTLDGLNITSGVIEGSSRDITIVNSTFSGPLRLDGLVNSNVVLDHDAFLNVDADGKTTAPARIALSYASGMHSGVTIQNSLLAGGDADGVQSGVGVNIINNEFRDILEKGGGNHTDAIQLIGAKGSIVRGNYIHDVATGIVAYDGLDHATIEDNVIDLTRRGKRPWGIEVYSDSGSVVRHNTVVHGAHCLFDAACGSIALDRKSGQPPGSGTVVTDNIATSVILNNGSTVAAQKRNLFRTRGGPGNLTGVPTYAGGPAPTAYLGFRLAAGSAGAGDGSDGTDVGIRRG